MINRRDLLLNFIFLAIFRYVYSNKVYAKKNNTLNKKKLLKKP